METKHTPGEWVQRTGEKPLPEGSFQSDICTKDVNDVAVAWGETKEEAEANGKLIASAPKLLAALVEADEYLGDKGLNYIGSGSMLHQEIKKAIKEAVT